MLILEGLKSRTLNYRGAGAADGGDADGGVGGLSLEHAISEADEGEGETAAPGEGRSPASPWQAKNDLIRKKLQGLTNSLHNNPTDNTEA